MNNGLNTGWVEIGPSSTAYTVAGTGDFEGNHVSDVLFRNTATSDTGFYNVSNHNAWVDVGPASTNYTIAGVGDFLGR